MESWGTWEILRMEPLCGTLGNLVPGFRPLPQTTPKLYWRNPKLFKLLGNKGSTFNRFHIPEVPHEVPQGSTQVPHVKGSSFHTKVPHIKGCRLHRGSYRGSAFQRFQVPQRFHREVQVPQRFHTKFLARRAPFLEFEGVEFTAAVGVFTWSFERDAFMWPPQCGRARTLQVRGTILEKHVCCMKGDVQVHQ